MCGTLWAACGRPKAFLMFLSGKSGEEDWRNIATKLPGAILNSSAGPKGGGQDARNNVLVA